MAAKPDPERDWRKALEVHAHNMAAAAFHHAAPYMRASVRGADDLGGRPTVEICGPDGEWRRYYVRLTPAAQHAPLDPAHLGAMQA